MATSHDPDDELLAMLNESTLNMDINDSADDVAGFNIDEYIKSSQVGTSDKLFDWRFRLLWIKWIQNYSIGKHLLSIIIRI